MTQKELVLDVFIARDKSSTSGVVYLSATDAIW
jgi:hypothetical protein